MSLSFHRYIFGLSLLSSLAISSPAVAQDVEAADALFDRGVAEMKAGRYKKGCPLIAESLRVDPQPGTLFTLSQCEVKWGRVATAVARLDDYLQLYERLTPDQKVQQQNRPNVVKEQRDNLVPEVPQVTLLLPPEAPAGTIVRCDGAVVASAALGLRLPMDPGEHMVSTKAPGGALWEWQLTVAKGEKKSLMLRVKVAPTTEERPTMATPIVVATPEPAKQADLPPATPGGTSGRRVAADAIGGVGVASLALGGVMGGLVLAKKRTIAAHCMSPAAGSDTVFCDPTGVDAGNSAKTLGLVSTIGFAAGLAGVGTALVLLLTEPKPAKPTTGARGPWISVDVLSAGPTGATLGAHGSF